MRTLLAIAIFFGMVILCMTGCQKAATSTTPKPTTASAATATLAPLPRTTEPEPSATFVTTLPMGSVWDMENNPVVIKDSASFGLHVLVITDEQITLIYSASNASGINPGNGDLKLTDNKNNEYKMLGTTILNTADTIQVVSITFEGPKRGVNRLDLAVQSKAGQLQVNVARADPPDTEPEVGEGMQNFLYREGYLDQSGYRISFNGNLPWKEDMVAKQANSKGMTKEEILQANATKAAKSPESPEPPTAFS